MAAVDPSESPKRQKSPAEEVETSGGRTEAAEPECGSSNADAATVNKTAESRGGERGADVGSDGGCVASHSEVNVESGAGADKTTCHLPEDLTSPQKMAEAPVGDQRDFDWSEPEEDGDDEAEEDEEEEEEHEEEEETKTHQRENDKCDTNDVPKVAKEMQQEPSADASVVADAQETPEKEKPGSDEKEAEKEPAVEVQGVEEAAKDNEGAGKGREAESTVKLRKCRLMCKECGKCFTRRETFNLHRHFHAHEDELTPLTCKECGLTFKHRSSLIKHRNEHKEEEQQQQQLVTPKREVQTKEEGSFGCAECKKIFSTVDKLRDHNCSNTTEKPYHCPLCRQEFQFKVSVTKHMMSHSQESIFTCQECNQTFPDSVALRCHQRCHATLKPYECPECGMVFKHYSVMEDHRRKHTDNTRSHLCNICGKTFKYSSLLHQHQYLHTGQKPFRCPECGKKFAFAQNMKAHCRQHRLRETNPLAGAAVAEQPSKQQQQQQAAAAAASTQDTVRGKENTHQSEEPRRTFNCPLCPQTFISPANLRAHMLIHEAEHEMLERTPRPPREFNKSWEKGHNCPHCPCVYRDETSLNLHMLSVHKAVAQYLENVSAASQKQLTPLSSDNMQAKFKSDSASNKSYKCECGKTFRHRSVLELHMRIHSKDKPYQCKVCGKGFRFSSYLQQHLIIHTGKKPYKCPDCGKDFAFMQNMKTHQKLHQEKPFRCTSCRKGYSDESQLQHHMLSHNGEKPHKCELCEKSFGLAYLLRDHMNTHTGERPHRCDECHKTFSWFSSLLVHQKIHARKRQGFGQYNNSYPAGTRTRGRGSRGRRGGRLVLGWTRPPGGSGTVGSHPPSYPVSAPRDAELHRRAVQPQSSMQQPSRMELRGRQQKEPWLSELHPPPVQWKVDGGKVMLVPSSQQQRAGWAESPLITQSGPASAPDQKESGAQPAAKKNSPTSGGEVEQHRQLKAVAWSGAAEFPLPTPYLDGAALWSVKPALLPNSQSSPNKPGQDPQPPRWTGAAASAQKEAPTPPQNEEGKAWDLSNPQVVPPAAGQPEKPWNGCEPPQKQWASGSAGASTSAQVDQSSATPVSTTTVSHGAGGALWDLQTAAGTPKTINSPEKRANNQDFPLQQKPASSGWAGVQTATQKVPISIQYEPHRFAQGIGTPVWGFQSSPVAPQTLLTGQLKPGNGQEQQQPPPMVTGTQIIINQPSPFFSPPLAPLPPLALPGPHPLHSVAVGALPRPPNIFFTPQAVMSERAHMPQTLPLPQLAPQTEPHKLGPRLPFAPERLLQCMICGCSLPRELDLQMHYLQHAQGEI